MSTIVADGTVPERQWSPNVTAASLARLAQRVVVAAPSGAIAIEAPFTGEPLGEVPAGTQGDVVAAVAAASAAQRDWAQRPLSERAALLLRFHDLAIAHAREALDLIQLETGKARRHAFEELEDIVIQARYYAHSAAAHLGPTAARAPCRCSPAPPSCTIPAA